MYLSSGVWLISLNTMFSGVILVVQVFLQLNSISLGLCTTFLLAMQP